MGGSVLRHSDLGRRYLRLPRAGTPIVFAIVALAALAAPALAAAACDQWTNTSGGSWDTGANWSSGTPTPTSDVCIQAGGTYTVTMSDNVSVGSLTLGNSSGGGTQTLDVDATPGNNATLTLGANSTINQTGLLEMDSPTDGYTSFLSSAATAVTLDNFGSLIAQSESGNANYLRVALVNESTGTITVASNTLYSDSGYPLTNKGTFTTDSKQGSAIPTFAMDNGSDLFTNQGTVNNNGTLILSSNASFTQNGNETGNPVEIFSAGLLSDISGTGSFQLADSAGLTGTIPAGQTVTAEAFPGHNSTVYVSGTVSNYGTLVLDSPTNGYTSFLAAASTGTNVLDNYGTLIAQSESGNANYLRVALFNESTGTITVASNTLYSDSGYPLTNKGTFTTDSKQVTAIPTFAMDNGSDLFTNQGTVNNNGTLILSSNASFTQNGNETGNPVEIFSAGLLSDISGTGSFQLADSAGLTGTIPAGQTVTAEAFPGHNSTVYVSGTVSNYGTLVLDSPTNGYTSFLAAASTGTNVLDNYGTLIAQSESGNANYLRVALFNESTGTITVASNTLYSDSGYPLTNKGTFTTDSKQVTAIPTFAMDNGSDLFTNQGTVNNNGTLILSSNASFTQNGNETGNPVEIFSAGLLSDISGTGSFQLADSAGLTGTIPAGQTVTAEAFPGHNSTVYVSGTVSNYGTLVLDSPTNGYTSFLAAASTGTNVLDNYGTLIAQTESGNANYLRVDVNNEPTGSLKVASGALIVDSGTDVLNDGLVEVAAGAQLNFTSGSDKLVNGSDGTIQPDIASAGSFGTINLSSGAVFTPGGTILPNPVGGYKPPVGTVFDVITGSSGGTFAATSSNFVGDYSQAHIIAVKAEPAAPPVLGKTENVSLVSGIVYVKLPGSDASKAPAPTSVAKGQGFIPLTQARQIPIGSQIDARRGTLALLAAPATKRGKVEKLTLGGAIFISTQSRKGLTKGLTTISLLEGAFSGAPSYASCPKADADRVAADGPAAQAAKASPKVLQTLKASDNHGHFATKGRYSSASVLGTIWTTSDRCDGTLTTVQRGTVDVYDFATRKTIAVHAGHGYLAKA